MFSAAILLFQVTLTRLFSIAQFYHFAFLVVSLALLGFGASGSLLAVWPRLRTPGWRAFCVVAFAPATIGAYLILNQWSFDSYAIAWDRTQVWWLLANLLCLTIPFTLAGLVVGAFLSDSSLPIGRVYGSNMIGSALGAAAAPLLLAVLGDARIIVLCGGLAALAALLLVQSRRTALLSAFVLIALLAILIVQPGVMEIKPSAYKALTHFRRNPDATLEGPRYNAYSRLDLVYSSTIHSAPGLSMTYLGTIPPEIGLLLDGDSLMPVVQAENAAPAFALSMPAAVPYGLYRQPDALILGTGGGLDAWLALQYGARSVVTVESNGLVVGALRGDLRTWSGLVDDPRLKLVHQEPRAYVEQTDRRFDIVQLELTDPYRPVTSGAFTLTEDYELTVEGFRAYLDRLNEGGLFTVTRWLQNPPSEDLRVLALILTALDADHPAQHIIAFRSFQTVTFLVKTSPFAPEEVAFVLDEAERLKYDMVLAPDLPPHTVNRYARLETPIYHQTYTTLLNAADHGAFYAEYDFDVRPSTDNQPFFFHYFKWSQTPAILDSLGQTWQPFGGSGYFVLVALLIFSLVASLVFVMLPIVLTGRFRRAIRAAGAGLSARVLVYFGCLGLSFLMIEISTIQRYVLILGQPTLAIATVLAALLLFSGIGSTFSDRLAWGRALLALVALALAWPWIANMLAAWTLQLPLAVRWPLSVLSLAPLGFLMGIPFARGLDAIRPMPDLVPWAWAINGGASVVAGVLAGLLALSLGFAWVLWIGGALYALAWISRPNLA